MTLKESAQKNRPPVSSVWGKSVVFADLGKGKLGLKVEYNPSLPYSANNGQVEGEYV